MVAMSPNASLQSGVVSRSRKGPAIKCHHAIEIPATCATSMIDEVTCQVGGKSSVNLIAYCRSYPSAISQGSAYDLPTSPITNHWHLSFQSRCNNAQMKIVRQLTNKYSNFAIQ